VEAMKACYLDLPLMGEKGEISNSFIEKLREIIGETFPIKKGYRENSEEATLTVYYPKGQVKASLFRCLVTSSCIIGNNMTINYKRQKESGRHYYSRYYLHEREADIVNGDYYEFLLIDNALLVKKITEADKEITQETIDTEINDLMERERVEKEQNIQPES